MFTYDFAYGVQSFSPCFASSIATSLPHGGTRVYEFDFATPSLLSMCVCLVK